MERKRPDTLVWVGPVGHIGHPHEWVARWLRRRFTRTTCDRRRRLYVTREGYVWRRVVNEPAVVDALRPFGFETVSPESLSFAQQVQIFAEAQVVVSAHGAGLTNVVFGNRLVTIELFEPTFVNGCYYALSDAAGHSYWYIFANPAGDQSLAPAYRDLDVDIDLLVDTITAAIERQAA